MENISNTQDDTVRKIAHAGQRDTEPSNDRQQQHQQQRGVTDLRQPVYTGQPGLSQSALHPLHWNTTFMSQWNTVPSSQRNSQQQQLGSMVPSTHRNSQQQQLGSMVPSTHRNSQQQQLGSMVPSTHRNSQQQQLGSMVPSTQRNSQQQQLGSMVPSTHRNSQQQQLGSMVPSTQRDAQRDAQQQQPGSLFQLDTSGNHGRVWSSTLTAPGIGPVFRALNQARGRDQHFSQQQVSRQASPDDVDLRSPPRKLSTSGRGRRRSTPGRDQNIPQERTSRPRSPHDSDEVDWHRSRSRSDRGGRRGSASSPRAMKFNTDILSMTSMQAARNPPDPRVSIKRHSRSARYHAAKDSEAAARSAVPAKSTSVTDKGLGRHQRNADVDHTEGETPGAVAEQHAEDRERAREEIAVFLKQVRDRKRQAEQLKEFAEHTQPDKGEILSEDGNVFDKVSIVPGEAADEAYKQLGEEPSAKRLDASLLDNTPHVDVHSEYLQAASHGDASTARTEEPDTRSPTIGDVGSAISRPIPIRSSPPPSTSSESSGNENASDTSPGYQHGHTNIFTRAGGSQNTRSANLNPPAGLGLDSSSNPNETDPQSPHGRSHGSSRHDEHGFQAPDLEFEEDFDDVNTGELDSGSQRGSDARARLPESHNANAIGHSTSADVASLDSPDLIHDPLEPIYVIAGTYGFSSIEDAQAARQQGFPSAQAYIRGRFLNDHNPDVKVSTYWEPTYPGMINPVLSAAPRPGRWHYVFARKGQVQARTMYTELVRSGDVNSAMAHCGNASKVAARILTTTALPAAESDYGILLTLPSEEQAPPTLKPARQIRSDARSPLSELSFFPRTARPTGVVTTTSFGNVTTTAPTTAKTTTGVVTTTSFGNVTTTAPTTAKTTTARARKGREQEVRDKFGYGDFEIEDHLSVVYSDKFASDLSNIRCVFVIARTSRPGGTRNDQALESEGLQLLDLWFEAQYGPGSLDYWRMQTPDDSSSSIVLSGCSPIVWPDKKGSSDKLDNMLEIMATSCNHGSSTDCRAALLIIRGFDGLFTDLTLWRRLQEHATDIRICFWISDKGNRSPSGFTPVFSLKEILNPGVTSPAIEYVRDRWHFLELGRRADEGVPAVKGSLVHNIYSLTVNRNSIDGVAELKDRLRRSLEEHGDAIDWPLLVQTGMEDR